MGCSRDPATKSRAFVASGDKFAAAGKYPEAAIEYRNAVKYTPASAEAHTKLANAAARAHDINTSLIESLRAAELEPGDAAAQVRAASVYLLVGRYGDAKDRAEAALRVSPTDLDAHLALGEALAGLQDTTRSVATLTEAVRLAPDSPNAHVALASAYWRGGRKMDADVELNRAVRLAPGDARANRALGQLRLATGRAAAAEQNWKVVAAATDGEPMALADFYTATDRLEDAERELTQLAAVPVTEDAARVRLAGVRFARGRRDAALADTDRVLARNPRNVEALLVKAQILAATGKFEDAVSAARAASAVDPASVRASIVTGDLLAKQGRDEEAVQAFEAAAQLAPADPSPYLGIARVRIRQQRPGDALGAAERARAKGANSPAVTLLLLDALARTGDRERAAREAQLAIATWPQVAEFHSRLGSIAIASNDPDKARRAFDEALKLAPGMPDALRGLAALDFAEKRGRQAQARIDAQLRARPRDPALLLLSAGTSMVNRDERSAEATLKRLIAIEPGNLDGFTALGNLYLREGRLRHAGEQFAIAAAHATNAAPATIVGMILEAQGQRGAARTQYERTLSQYPRAAVAANNLAWMDLDAGRLDEALQWATVAREEMPRRAEASDTLGWVYLRRGDASQAIPWLAEATELKPDNPAYHYHLGAAYASSGRQVAAATELGRALSSTTPFAGRDDAVRIVRQLETERKDAGGRMQPD